MNPEQPAPQGKAATPLEGVGIVALCFGWFIVSSLSTMLGGYRSSQFSNASFAGLVVFELLLGSIALYILHVRGHRLADLLPTPTWRGCVIGIFLYIAASALGWLAFVAFDSAAGREPLEQLMPAVAFNVPLVVVMAMVNGAYEETFLLGYLLRGFRNHGRSFALSLSLLVRVSYHLYQGPVGATAVLAMGFVLSLYYLRTSVLWPVVFAHTLADIIPFS